MADPKLCDSEFLLIDQYIEWQCFCNDDLFVSC